MKRSVLLVLLAVACGVGSPGSNRNGETTPANDAKKADPDAWRSAMPKPGTGRFNGRFSEVLLSKLKALGRASPAVGRR